MLNWIWAGLLLIAFLVAVVAAVGGKPDVLQAVVTALFDSAKTGFEINTIAMALSLGAVLIAGALSDRFGRRPVIAVVSGVLMVVSYPLMAFMAGGQWIAVFVGQVVLALLVSEGALVENVTSTQ